MHYLTPLGNDSPALQTGPERFRLERGRISGKKRPTATGSGSHSRKGIIMDYKAAGAPKKGNKIPRHTEHNAPGSDKNPFGKRPSKDELVARLKAKVVKVDKDRPA